MNLPTLERLLEPAIVRQYLSASGDDNPVHTHIANALQLGLEANPVPGMLLVGMATSHVSQVLDTDEFHSITSRFVAPVLIGTGIEIQPKIMTRYSDGSARVVRVMVSSQGKLAAIVEIIRPQSAAASREP